MLFLFGWLVQAIAAIPSGVPFWSTPASLVEQRRIAGGWFVPGLALVITPSDARPGRIAGSFFGSVQSRPAFFTKKGDMLLVSAAPEKIDGGDRRKPPPREACMYPMVFRRIDRNRLSMSQVDISATLQANNWLDGRKVEDDCPAFLGNMSVADQQRVKIVLTRTIVFNRLPAAKIADAMTPRAPIPATSPEDMKAMSRSDASNAVERERSATLPRWPSGKDAPGQRTRRAR